MNRADLETDVAELASMAALLACALGKALVEIPDPRVISRDTALRVVLTASDMDTLFFAADNVVFRANRLLEAILAADLMRRH